MFYQNALRRVYGVIHYWKILFLKLNNLKISAPLSSYHIGLLDTETDK